MGPNTDSGNANILPAFLKDSFAIAAIAAVLTLLPAAAHPAFAADPDLAQQLLNEVCVEGVTPTGHTSIRWEKRGPNEWRDVFRYNWALAWHYTKQGRHWPLIARIAATPPKPQPAESRPAGRRELGRRTLARR